MDVADSAEGCVVAYDLQAFALLEPEARRPFFEEAAARRGVIVPIIEKDFWVVWTLRALFEFPDSKDFVFKGGTSLSKAFGLIDRFSEDIDLVIDRARFGFAGAADIAQAPSGEQRRQRRENLDAAVSEYLRDALVPSVTNIAQATGATIAIDPEDPLSILIHYRACAPEHPYVRPFVRIETGGRADNWPTASCAIRSFVAIEFPQAFENDEVIVRTIDASRTFLEKLTILHKTAFIFEADETADVSKRFSRHYYDVFRMSKQGLDAALFDDNLLEAVRVAAQMFFPQTKARYERFEIGTIRLTPSTRGMAALARDYVAMRDMIFGEPPPFDEILAAISELEGRINASAG